MRDVVVESGEIGLRGAVAAIRVERGQVFGFAISKALPVKEAQVDAGDERGHQMAGERGAPDAEGVIRREGLGRGAKAGDDQGRVVLHADFADGGPLVDLEGARDPGDDELILLGMKVDPAEGVLRLLRGERCGEERGEDSKRNKTPEKNKPHGTRYTRGGAAASASRGKSSRGVT